MEQKENTQITLQTKGKLPRLPFVLLKEKILGPEYALSIAVVGSKKSKELNYRYRGKNNPTNILSFPLSKKSGELLLELGVIETEYKKFNMTKKNFIGFLLIHGMLHLKGMDHGSTMERQEKKYQNEFGFLEKNT